MPLQSITSLVYVSTARPGLAPDDLLAIMSAAQRNNPRFSITGLILYNGFNFMQCIEGERSAAQECLRRIERDDRHSGMTIVGNQQRPSRQFEDWHMAGQYVEPRSDAPQTDMDGLLSRETVSEATRTLFQSFLSFGIRASAPDA